MLLSLTGLALAQAAEPASSPGPVELTNYQSGISLRIDGRNGRDYAVERLYHDALVDDRSVIYIRSGTKLSLEHNQFNVWQGFGSTCPFKLCGVDGRDGKPNSGDEGVIRYKVDRDQWTGANWAPEPGSADTSCPAFTQPFSFAELEYEPGSKVLGSLGLNPGAVPGKGYYYRGQQDAFGDEWHTLTVADDDRAFLTGCKPHMMSSDGKVFRLVVDPKTPCLSLRTRGAAAQFYTTPAKTYFLPRIHVQTTYLTDGVDLLLSNVSNEQPMSYRIDQGKPQPYTAAVRSEDFTSGPHVLEYWIEGGPHKTRAVIKNPASPGASEPHPRLLWADDAELAGIKARMAREPYKGTYERYRSEGFRHQDIGKILGRGERNWVEAALANAFVARLEGAEAKTPQGTRSFASYAKQVLLDNKLCYDPVGMELSHNFAPMPTAEWNSYGYYVVNEVFDLALGYDLLISFYRADQVAGGITPIEDLKIRDALAHWNAVQLYDLRGFEDAPQPPRPEPGKGMWDFARHCGAVVAAMAMPTYDTAYYGTSGFDGTTKARHQGIPFAGQAFTWKELFIEADNPVGTTPQITRRFNQLAGGLIREDGSFYDRSPYFSYGLMGHCFQILANTAALACGKRWPYLELAFNRAEEGTLEGGKVNKESDKGGKRHTQALLVNPRFPELGSRIRDRIQNQPEKADNGKANRDSIGRLLNDTGIYGLIWYQDDLGKPRP